MESVKFSLLKTFFTKHHEGYKALTLDTPSINILQKNNAQLLTNQN